MVFRGTYTCVLLICTMFYGVGAQKTTCFHFSLPHFFLLGNCGFKGVGLHSSLPNLLIIVIYAGLLHVRTRGTAAFPVIASHRDIVIQTVICEDRESRS